MANANTNPSPATVEKVSKLITSQPKNTTAQPVTASTLNKSAVAAANPKKVEGDMKAAAATANTGTTNPVTECDKIIRESDTLVEALESVAKLYNIPEENILCDDTLDSIKVQGDTIIAPSISPQGKNAAIMKSIAAVLDYISQRINQKVTDLQMNNIEKGVIADHIKNDANPAKGKVINRYVDPDGNEVLAYDSGLVDMANTVTAQQFVNELREAGMIPEIKTTDSIFPQKRELQYFNDNDDITTGVSNIQTQGGSDYGPSGVGDTVATPNNTDMPADYDGAKEVNMAEQLGESADIIEMMVKRNDTNHLGYDIMMEQGFNFVKPIDFFLESAGKKKKAPAVEDIKHLKFDNSHIMKAIKYMNAARAEQDYAVGKNFDIGKLVNSKNWNMAVKELEAQFDCHLNIRFVEGEEYGAEWGNGGTIPLWSGEKVAKCHVSKTKGFQLNGQPIIIFFFNKFLTMFAPTDQKLFGQFVIGVLLHEIFHDISAALRLYNAEFKTMMSTTMLTAAMAKSPKVKRKLVSNFVEAANKAGFINMNLVQRKAYAKELLYLSAVRENDANLAKVKSLIEDGDPNALDEWIEKKEKQIKSAERGMKSHVLTVSYLLLAAANGAFAGVSFATGNTPVGIAFAGIALSNAILAGAAAAVRKQALQNVEDRKSGKLHTTEEHWADMFASMYSLPVALFSHPTSRMVPNAMRDDQIKRIHQIELAQVNIFGDPHPPTMERMSASVKTARQLLDSKTKLNPDVKKYLEWIVENFSKIDEVEDIDTLYSKATFDPKTAEDLDRHVQNLINKAGITVTEAMRYLLLPDEGIV